MKSKFYHMHTHTEYSLNDGMIKSKILAKKLKSQGVDAIAITEHGEMLDMPSSYLALQDEGIKLIIGMEAYVAPRSRLLKESREDAANFHLLLLAENQTGYDNLKILASEAAINGFYYKPRVDKEILREYHEGIIASSACLGGSINKILLNGKYDDAKKEALEYLDIFGKGNFFLEIQRHGLKEQEQINPLIIKLSKETGIPLIATNDCHYLNKEDWEAHDTLMAIQAKTTIDDSKRKKYGSREFYIKSPEEMIEIFSDLPEAIENTVRIAERCNVSLEFGVNKIPPFKLPKKFHGTESEYLRKLVMDGVKDKYGDITNEIIDRVDFEIGVIEKMGYVNYFLINWDFFRFCKEGTYEIDEPSNPDWDPILTGPGRGSGCGSIVAFSLDITKIDPLRFNLLFERFLSVDRVTMPDIDSDFESTRRQEVIDYVVYKYGRENISQIIAFGTLAARAVIRKVGKARNYQLSLVDKIAKMIPQEIGITIKKALDINPTLKKMYSTDGKIKELLDFSMKLEGLATHCTTHAAGVLITDNKGVTAHVPLWKNDSAIVAQYSKDLLENLGLLKMDFLGLSTLGTLGDARRMVLKNHNVNINFDELYKLPTMEPLNIIREGKTEMIFQLSGGGMTNFMKELNPGNIEDIISGISLYRPGPMNEIPRFLFNKRNADSILYDIEGLDSILGETYGVIVYQEQCMQIVTKLAGFSKGDSDNFRRIISKKKLKEMPKQREWFIHGRKTKDYDYDGHLREYKNGIPGGVALGHSEKALNELFDKMVDFASYAFNKSHAAAYAFVAYVTAWFMTYYPVEFVAANLNQVIKSRDKIAKYINYARKVLDIEICEPDINKSSHKFEATADGKIIVSLSVKGASQDTIRKIITDRDNNGDYKSLLDFIIRTRAFLDKSTYEGLISSGAFKSFGIVKSQLLAALDDFWEDAFKKSKDHEKLFNSKVSMYDDKESFDKLKPVQKNNIIKAIKKGFNFEEELLNRIDGILPNIDEYPEEICLRMEKEFLGIYLTNNPLYKYAYTIQTKNNFNISDIEFEVDEGSGMIMLSNSDIRNGQRVRFVTIINSISELTTKKKDLMARVELEDFSGIAGALIWPSTYQEIKDKLTENQIYMCYGTLKVSDDEAPTIIIDDVDELDDLVTERVIVKVKNEYESKDIIKLIKEDKMCRGMTPIYIEYKRLKVLLSKKYWVNLNYIKNKINDLEIKIW